jgi:hypothetical protein
MDNIRNLPDAIDTATNFQAAMERANDTLRSGVSAVRVAIMLTDGRPEPDENAQITVITDTHIPMAQTNSFRYYTIGLGNGVNVSLLQLIASSTNGDYTLVSSPTDLDQTYTNLFDIVAHTVVAGQIMLRERVDTNALDIIPGSFAVDVDLPMPSNQDLSNFYSSGVIDIPMGELRSNRLHSISFRVRTKSCLPIDSPEEFTTIQPNLNQPNLNPSRVTYLLGNVPTTLPLPLVELTCRKDPDLECEKSYEPATNTVTLSCQSKFVATAGVDKNIYNISIWEYPSIQYQYIDGSAVPTPEAFIPGNVVDLLYWHIDVLQPQEIRVFNFQVGQRAYIPRDGNPLRLNAVKLPDGVDAMVYYTPAGSAQKVKRLPQVDIAAYLLDDLPAGRPDLNIRQAFNEEELVELGLTPYNPETDPNMPSDGPTTEANWPSLENFLSRWETKDIWVDSQTSNGYVSDWSSNNTLHVQNRINHVIVAPPPMTTYWSYIEGQGDLFNQNDSNRVYVTIHNSGEAQSTLIANGISLYAKNYSTDSWDLVQSVDLPIINARTKEMFYFEIPSGTLQNDHLQQFGPATWSARTAEFRVVVSTSPNERHTNNNISSEKVFVIQ